MKTIVRDDSILYEPFRLDRPHCNTFFPVTTCDLKGLVVAAGRIVNRESVRLTICKLPSGEVCK